MRGAAGCSPGAALRESCSLTRCSEQGRAESHCHCGPHAAPCGLGTTRSRPINPSVANSNTDGSHSAQAQLTPIHPRLPRGNPRQQTSVRQLPTWWEQNPTSWAQAGQTSCGYMHELRLQSRQNIRASAGRDHEERDRSQCSWEAGHGAIVPQSHMLIFDVVVR